MTEEQKREEARKKLRTTALLLQNCTDPGMQIKLIKVIEKAIRNMEGRI